MEQLHYTTDVRRMFDELIRYHSEHAREFFEDGDPESKAKMQAARDMCYKLAAKMSKQDKAAASRDLDLKFKAFRDAMFFYTPDDGGE